MVCRKSATRDWQQLASKLSKSIPKLRTMDGFPPTSSLPAPDPGRRSRSPSPDHSRQTSVTSILTQVDQVTLTLPSLPNGVSSPARPSVLNHPSHHSSVEGSSTTYKQVPADEDAFPQTECPKRPIEFFGILTDFVSTALPLGLVIFTVMLWRLDGTEATDAKYTSWENAITLVSLSSEFPIRIPISVIRSNR